MKAVVINSTDSSLWARWLTSVQPVLALNSNTWTDSCLISWSVLSIFKILLTGLQTQRTVLSPSLMLCDTPYDFLFVTAYVFFIYLFIAHGQSVKLSLLFPGCVSSLLSFCFHGNLFILPEFHYLFCVTCAHVNVICLWYGLWDRDHLWVYPLVLTEQSQMLWYVAWDEFLQIFMLCFNDKKQMHVSRSLFLRSRYRCIFLQ